MSLTENRLTAMLRQPWRQYAAAFGVVCAISGFDFWLQRWTGYQALALIYLLGVVMLALVVGRGRRSLCRRAERANLGLFVCSAEFYFLRR